ncbi:MAG: hypothetical protein R3358_06040 [Woeseiaceae bacterium]|nr:hypothetical protein [Woeseiaceae bacterium]
MSVPWTSHGMLVSDALTSPTGAASESAESEHVATQGRGKSLSEAIEQVKRSGNVERVLDARTEVSGGRETHVIKVLTKDGQVRTHRIPGRKR